MAEEGPTAATRLNEHTLNSQVTSPGASAGTQSSRLDATRLNDNPLNPQAASPASPRSRSSRLDESRFSCSICLDAVVDPVVTQCGHLYCWPCLYRWLEPGMLPGERQSLTGNLLALPQPVDESRRICPVCKAPCSVPTIVPIYALIERPVSPTAVPRVIETDGSTDKEKPEGEEILDENDEPETTTLLEDSLSRTGLRQRRGVETNAEGTSNRETARDSAPVRQQQQQQQHVVVPARPSASPPRSHVSQSAVHTPHRDGNTLLITTPLTARPGNHTRGIAGNFHQALMNRVNSAEEEVPPLHHRGTGPSETVYLVEDPTASEYLSRILLLLGSFVILCLLLF